MEFRRPIVSGQFYASNAEELKEEISKSFLSKFGVRKIPKIVEKEELIGAVSPHAGYFFSGACASHTYYRISQSKKPDVFLIFGVNHNGIGKNVATSVLNWRTPLGEVKVDQEFARALTKNKVVEIDEIAHQYEHSIEVQLPFLQFIFGDFKFCPICFQNISFEDCEKVAEEVLTIKREMKKKITMIASSDFTHYGYGYGYVPFSGSIEDVRKKLYELDERAIKYILKLDAKGFYDYVTSQEMTICGYIPITVLTILANKLGAKKGELLKYYTSGDVIGDYRNAVGYASIAIY
ncbi:MAG: AmmeMemoRadiSam system protein B [Candidatus Parvarchaeota archaeon]|nr:AmmeMemoRadiSam system protein B [Candidatus Jingweiarchaeum tengchongense]MCW1298491.1 AmmeMemoRadiSam system protein B [Candidatus Jingweiarchaeum tengchongense]MCW1300263.1 AmmeMemoRadiSam system protein B [Candidatus Jingweiarchaeum tengchongense]MCW1304503.1 AmmeMemoRadiSam system protein B [Candidatus Jingweiarchaeum tengchongense]MCW1305769.1 AmmeMemoRadiSam system protein B [Candidatus Jingweiarchaeum tengchongense]